MSNLILKTAEPLIITDALKWDFLKWDIDKWSSIFENQQLPVRCGKNMYTQEPQYDYKTETTSMTFKDFIEHQEKHPDEWLNFDYKYLKEWLVNVPEFKNVNLSELGLPEIDFENTKTWIGTAGAHTPCHADTYCCKIVAQVYGRKRWILFLPDENLQPTRTPYNELNTYSKLNFFTPSVNTWKGTSRCRTVVLNPGDILILPNKWWHYVENLDLAISVNTTMTLPVDHDGRLGESITGFMLSQIAKQLPDEQLHFVLTPRELSLINKDNAHDLIAIILRCLSMYRVRFLNRNTELFPLKDALKKYKNVAILEQLSEIRFKRLQEIQKSKFDYEVDESIDIEKEEERQIKKIINAVIHKDVINLIKEKLLQDE